MRPRNLLPVFIPAILLAAGVSAWQPVSQAEADYRQAQQRAQALELEASKLKGRLERLRAEQKAAVEGLEAAEARITLASLRESEAKTRADEVRRNLAVAQRPASLLIAGLATMARRPPLLALADAGDVETLVRTRILFDTTMPEIRRRSTDLKRDVAASSEALAAARAAHRDLEAGRTDLEKQKRRLAALEREVAAESLKAGDQAFAATDTVEALGGTIASDREAAAMARDLIAMDVLPTGPGKPAHIGPAGYRLPADALVTEGLGAVDRSGVRSRGLTLATVRGALIVAPAAGVVRFSGALGDIDGVILIDHGGGWISVLTNIASPLAKGDRVSGGETVGRALGPIGVELSHRGKRHSPALIAGSSAPLSNDGKRG